MLTLVMIATLQRVLYSIDPCCIYHIKYFFLLLLLLLFRWWYEQVGYWGAPGTKAPGDEAPVPILPLNVPSLESIDAYEERYGEVGGRVHKSDFHFNRATVL
jgi:hypothetical protein